MLWNDPAKHGVGTLLVEARMLGRFIPDKDSAGAKKKVEEEETRARSPTGVGPRRSWAGRRPARWAVNQRGYVGAKPVSYVPSAVLKVR